MGITSELLSDQSYTEQKISVALALTDLFLEKLGKGICRIHGGGFAGVIMCVVPKKRQRITFPTFLNLQEKRMYIR